MRHPLITMSLFSLLGTASILGWAPPVQAANSNIEATIQSYGDLSMFYQALLNTGVINELNENQHYTIFAPTNAAFAQIRPETYPCFYTEQCRPQIAALLRNHIIAGRHDYADLVSYGQSIQTLGTRRILIEEPYTSEYTVAGKRILSRSDVAGNIIYRIDGVIATPDELQSFQTVSMIAPTQSTVTTEKTITRRTYLAPTSTQAEAYPAGVMNANPNRLSDNTAETTTVIDSYTTQQ